MHFNLPDFLLTYLLICGSEKKTEIAQFVKYSSLNLPWDDKAMNEWHFLYSIIILNPDL